MLIGANCPFPPKQSRYVITCIEMSLAVGLSLTEHFSDPRPYFSALTDPRRQIRNTLHQRQDIVMIMLCAVISGVEDWVGIQAFAEERESWLCGFLELPNGIPAHDTLSDLMGVAFGFAPIAAEFLLMAQRFLCFAQRRFMLLKTV